MRCQVLYFSKIHSTPLPPPPKNGTQESSKVQQMCIKLTCRTTTALMITSMLPCARWAVSLESGATCNIAESSTATNQPTHSHSLSLSLTQQKCSAHEHDSPFIRLLERISKEIPTDLHVLLLFQVAMA
jgi:hypothetical protein